MKKNAIARMTAPTETVGTKFRKLNILPKLLCLLLALLVWLAIVDVTKAYNDASQDDAVVEQAE